jgi:hypothetical protein
MRTLRLMSTTAAILLLSAGIVSAQGIKTDGTPGAPAAQQTAPAKEMAPAVKSDQIKTPEKTGQAAPIVPDSKKLTTDKGAPASVATKASSEVDGSAVVKSKRTERHRAARYASRHHGPLYNTYRGDHGYYGCRGHRHSWMPWLGC